MDRILVIFCKFLGNLISFLRLGSGGTWPGEIAVNASPHILINLTQNLKKGIILVAGTNGKTTTSLMLARILKTNGDTVILNNSGANLLNGIISSLIKSSSWSGIIRSDWGVFEVDENSLPLVLSQVTPKIIVLNNLFRDQLDRYGEVDVIVEKWQKALTSLPQTTTVILNSDDPAIAYLGKDLNAKTLYFGLENKKLYLSQKEHATDSIFCMHCGKRLSYEGTYYSHLGKWKCTCANKRIIPQLSDEYSPLPGVYNIYNTQASLATAKVVGISLFEAKRALADFTPAFGRQEEFEIEGRKIKLFLSKNPTGFNQSLRTVLSMGAKSFLFVLNDRIPDGRDVSWIWDVDFEQIPPGAFITVSGDRVYDMAIRMKYALDEKSKISNPKSKIKSNTQFPFLVETDLQKAIHCGLRHIKNGDSLYILPTYSAMLEVRKILTGRKIL